MPFTCPKWECRESIPFSSKALACPVCVTDLFPRERVLQREPDEAKPRPKPKRERVPKDVRPYSREYRPLNDQEIEDLIREEAEEATALVDAYYRELQF